MNPQNSAVANNCNSQATDVSCGMTYAMNLLGGRWKILIIYKLSKRTHRFCDLKKNLPRITDCTLTQQLRALERDGLIIRTVFAEMPSRVEYALTAIAWELVPAWRGMEVWSESYQQRVALNQCVAG